MPLPFLLEVLKPRIASERKTQLIYAKNKYGDRLKVHDWQYRYIPSPRDPNENLGPCKDFFGRREKSECLCDHYKSEYSRANEQLDLKDDYIDPAGSNSMHLFNYYGYHDKKCNDDQYQERRNFPRIINNNYCMAPEYTTTMQVSYGPPIPQAMPRLQAPEEKFLLYRRMKGFVDERHNSKFMDDRIDEVNEQLRCARVGRGVSYNFMTGLNNDGSLPKEMTIIENNIAMRKLDQK